MRIETWRIERVRPYAENARRLNASAVAKVMTSLREFGWQQPIVVDADGVVIAGHARLEAARRMEMAEVPIVVAHLSAEKAAAYRLMDNRSHEERSWDVDLLRGELSKLDALNFDLSLTGFDTDELDELLRMPEAAETGVPADDDDRGAPITQPGDVWVLVGDAGTHRIGCGDACDAGFVRIVMADARPKLMVTDPPYGVAYDPAWRGEALQDGANRREGVVANDDRADWRDAWANFDGDVAYVWHAGAKALEVASGLEASGFKIRAQIIWAKARMALGRGDYHWKHEPCWYAVRDGRTSGWTGARDQTTLWEVGGFVDDEVVETTHGTQKPLECMLRPIMNNSARRAAVYDPFLGTGTTLMAAHQAARRCIGIDITPAYVDDAIRRWQRATGCLAVLDGDGRTWQEVAAARQPGCADALMSPGQVGVLEADIGMAGNDINGMADDGDLAGPAPPPADALQLDRLEATLEDVDAAGRADAPAPVSRPAAARASPGSRRRRSS